MNYYQVAENLGITLISFTAGVALGAFVVFQVTDTIVDSNQKVLITAINKNTTEVSNNIGKVKTGRKSTTDLDLTNNIDTIKKKRHWWQRKNKNK